MELQEITALFRKENPIKITMKDTSHGEEDFRVCLIVEYPKDKFVIKLADNGFTDQYHLKLWGRIAAEYKKLGYYCPQFFTALDGTFPQIGYEGHDCIAWGEEFSEYRSARDIINENFPDSKLMKGGYYEFYEDAVLMDSKVASIHFHFSETPSGYCMFEVFDESDEMDEIAEDAMKWKEEVVKLPKQYKEQADRIWRNWLLSREKLQSIYNQLPTSVFQADINNTNLLLDEDGTFKGVYDFNLGGREVYLNLIFRQAPYVCSDNTYEDLEKEDFFADSIKHSLEIARKGYVFTEIEKKAAPLFYKCIRPLWWKAVKELKAANGDDAKIQNHLNRIEYEQHRQLDFEKYM